MSPFNQSRRLYTTIIVAFIFLHLIQTHYSLFQTLSLLTQIRECFTNKRVTYATKYLKLIQYILLECLAYRTSEIKLQQKFLLVGQERGPTSQWPNSPLFILKRTSFHHQLREISVHSLIVIHFSYICILTLFTNQL